MKPIDIKGIPLEKHIFHNEPLDVYPTRTSFSKIAFWPENYRTVLHFDILEAEKNRPVSKLSLEEITEFLVGRPELRLGDLASSIKKNGVKVPLIILTNGMLLDGNRRYFACSHLFHEAKKEGNDIPEVLYDIPVYVIKKGDVDERTRQKILAEANFVNDWKVPWSLDVKAKVIDDFYYSYIKEGASKEETYKEIRDVYGEDKSTVNAYIETMELTRKFVSSAPKGTRNKFRENVQNKFLYFWEFRNKALKGRGALGPKELPKVKKLFFKMIETERFSNYKQVEPMIRSVRDPYAWKLLISSKGIKIDMVEALMKEQKAVRSAEDKVRNFLGWLQTKADPNSFTKATFGLLKKVIDRCSKLISRKRI
jgi:hypothetical protein